MNYLIAIYTVINDFAYNGIQMLKQKEEAIYCLGLMEKKTKVTHQLLYLSTYLWYNSKVRIYANQ